MRYMKIESLREGWREIGCRELPQALTFGKQIHSNADRYQPNLVCSCFYQLPGAEMHEARIYTIWNYTWFTAWVILV